MRSLTPTEAYAFIEMMNNVYRRGNNGQDHPKAGKLVALYEHNPAAVLQALETRVGKVTAKVRSIDRTQLARMGYTPPDDIYPGTTAKPVTAKPTTAPAAELSREEVIEITRNLIAAYKIHLQAQAEGANA
jgi:hypothetical protein